MGDDMTPKEQGVAAALENLLPYLSKFEDRRYWIGRQIDFFCRDARTNPTAGPFGSYHKAFQFRDGQIEVWQAYVAPHLWSLRIVLHNSRSLYAGVLVTQESLQRWVELRIAVIDLEKALNANG